MRSLLLACAVIFECLAGAAVAASSVPAGNVLGTGDVSIASALGTAITYQGKLDKNGVPVSGNCNLIFRLYDAAAPGGTQVGVTVTLSNQAVASGFFMGSLDFGAGTFNGQARWIEIQVQGPGDAGFTTLAPRQPVTAAPYALYAVAGAGGGSLTLPFTGSVANPGSNGFRVDNTATTGTGSGIYGQSNSSNTGASGVAGFSSAGRGVQGTSSSNAGVYGESVNNAGVWGKGGSGSSGVYGESPLRGVFGESTSGVGVWGKSTSASGLIGESQTWIGVYGQSTSNTGVSGKSTNGAGIYGESANSAGVWGKGGAGSSGVYGESALRGVFGESTSGVGVWGKSTSSSGIIGESQTWAGVYGQSGSNLGVSGKSTSGYGVYGEAVNSGGVGGYFRNLGGGEALHVDGRAVVKTLQILGGADLAERFETTEHAEPGTVMAIDPVAPGRMRVADEAYCRRVAGVVSGAESLAAGVVLGLEKTSGNDLPIALTGRVWVKCDATQSPIHSGDLLTTSPLAGYAMAAADARRSAGAVLGKAMTPLATGTGMVLVLVSLQ